MKKILPFCLAFLGILFSLAGQDQHPSIHQTQNEFYNHLGLSTDAEFDQYHGQKPTPPRPEDKAACNLNKIVFGWYPYWGGTAYTNLQWDLLSDFSYFSYEVDPATGNAVSTHSWATSAAVTEALTRGKRVSLTVTLFSDHAIFFGSSTSQQTLITNLINLVQTRGAHGICIDFEGVPASQKAAFTSFMQNLSNQFKAAVSGGQISLALYSVDWGDVFDEVNLVNYVDIFTIMGYDYYYGGSTTAGPTDPLFPFTTGYTYCLSRSVTYYLNAGIPKNKLVLGLPYYGYEWGTTTGTIPSSTTGAGVSRIFKLIKDNTSGNYSSPQRDDAGRSIYYIFGSYTQCFALDSTSFKERLIFSNQRDLAGIGIWALTYDNTYSDLWNVIKSQFTDCARTPCTGTIYDMGGPLRNYFSNEDYTYTIAPQGASKVTLNFSAFSLENNFDKLYLYDGATTASPSLGMYTGTTLPPNITTNSNALTLRFTSDGATVSTGFVADWGCVVDNQIPTTDVGTFPTWATNDFNLNFTDNGTGTDLKYRFYQVANYNGSDWRANATNGFFNDDFTNLSTDWTNSAGTWAINAGELVQSDEISSNTILSAALNQNSSTQYLYHAKMKIEGAGTNRRAGLHFHCDNPSTANRGNSYFIYLRPDSDKLQWYKVEADVFTLVQDLPYTFDPATFYDVKIIHDNSLGDISVWINDNLAGTWRDASPLTTNGDYISLRSGNCIFTVDNLRVYKKRAGSTVSVSVGSASTKDIRWNNPNPATPSGKVRSIVVDGVNLVSSISGYFLPPANNFNADYTAPTAAVITSTNIPSNTQASINWTAATDAHSAIGSYTVLLGSAAGLSDYGSTTVGGAATTASFSGLSLTNGATVYFTVIATNGASLTASAATTATAPSPFPVELIYFKGKKQGKNSLLTWGTGSEEDADYFEVQRSYDGANFEPIGKVKATNSSRFAEYEYIDDKFNTLATEVYYRLYQVDINGVRSFFTNTIYIRWQDLEDAFYWKIAPNPFVDDIIFYANNRTHATHTVSIKIISVDGKLIEERILEWGENLQTYRLNLRHLPAGTYFLQYQLEGKVETQKIVKK